MTAAGITGARAAEFELTGRGLVSRGAMDTVNLSSLQGAGVLLESSTDHHIPPTGIRGFIDTTHATDEPPRIQLVVDFPQMFGTTAHRRTIPLSNADVARLLASERNGSFEFVLDGPLDPAAAEVPPAVFPIS